MAKLEFKDITAVILSKENKEIKKSLLELGVKEVVFISSYFDVVKSKGLIWFLPDKFTINKELSKLRIDSEVITLPLVFLESESTKGVLNSCLWNLSLNSEPGKLDFELANKQIDLTLFGAFIPVEIFSDKENFNKELEIYQDFYFFNKVTSKEIIVKSFPKLLISTTKDLSFSNYTKEEKEKFYFAAKKINNSN